MGVMSRKRGWDVMPTAEMAAAPSPPTIIVSTEETSAMSTLSSAEGQARARQLPYASRMVGKGPFTSEGATNPAGSKMRFRKRNIKTSCRQHSPVAGMLL